MLHEPDRPAEAQYYLWLFRTGKEGPSIVLYDYNPSRAPTVPRKFSRGFRGYLHVDGYAGYYGILDVTLVGRWTMPGGSSMRRSRPCLVTTGHLM